MSETNITRCPHCQTTFRIRSEQLVAARGAVRCGSCLQVFKAANHLVGGAPKAPVSAPIKPASVKENIIFDDTDAKDTDTDADADAKDTDFDDIPEQINDNPLEDFGIRQPDNDSNETFDHSLQLDDSIFSMQEKAKPSRYSLLNDKQDSEFEFDNQFDNDHFNSNTDNSDESWADALLDVDKQEDDFVASLEDQPETDQYHLGGNEDDFVASLEDQPKTDQYHLSGNDDIEQSTIEVELSITDSVNDLLDEPLKFNNTGKKKPAVATASSFLWLWLSGATIMICALVAQVGYFKFDDWSRHPHYRPAYALSCDLLNCQLPAVQDVSKMKTQHFMVRPHPKVKQALYIDTLLINNADYQQPFPDLNLIFTGLNDQTIASRHFKPKEYLAGELAGSDSMPLNVPVHIAIEISNPGAEAVSYRIELIANH
ncbi:MAG: putative Zn finger-like uncharacterized protein [Oleispira sp.]|jgi:predicted Zn finger-like uncharacterized protein